MKILKNLFWHDQQVLCLSVNGNIYLSIVSSRPILGADSNIKLTLSDRSKAKERRGKRKGKGKEKEKKRRKEKEHM